MVVRQKSLELNPKIASNDEESFWQGVKDCVPTLLGYLSIGFAAGVVEKTAGLSMMEIALMSLLLYAGSGQFIWHAWSIYVAVRRELRQQCINDWVEVARRFENHAI